MAYRKFSADLIFDGFSFVPDNRVLISNEEGEIINLVNKEEAGEDIEVLKGILSPGLINCHCHLELSHLKGVIPPHTGLIDFLISVVTRRSEQNEAEILKHIAAAEQEMYAKGIVGVADIANTAHALKTKQISRLRWHNLIEVINFFDQSLPEKLKHYRAVLELHQPLNATSVLTPHAPYTVSSATYQAINEATAHQVISIHNQEAEAENELFQSGTGHFLRLYEAVGMQQSPFSVSRKSSLQTYLSYFTKGQTLLLVHNTFIKEEDILFVQQHARENNLKIVFCLCPGANNYIENTFPPVDLLVKHQCNVVLGTDSYSSNWQLSIAREMQLLQKRFSFLNLETILQWATSNGADAIRWKDLGAFRPGTKPGIVLLETNDGAPNVLSGQSERIL